MEKLGTNRQASTRPAALAWSAAPVSLVFALPSCALAMAVAAQLGLAPVRALASTCAQRWYAVGLAVAAVITLGSGARVAAALYMSRRCRPQG